MIHWLSNDGYRHLPLLALLVSIVAIVIGYRSLNARHDGKTYDSVPVRVGAVILIVVSCVVLIVLCIHSL